MKFISTLCFLLLSIFSACSQSITIGSIPIKITLLDKPEEFKVLNQHSILMAAGKGTDLHTSANGKYSSTNAPKCLFSPDSNFSFSAKVKPEFNKLYDGGALLVWTDSGNWAKVLIQNIGEKSILGLSVVKDSITDDSYFQISPAREIFLKLSKKGRVFNFYSSVDGKEWTMLREFVYHKPDNMRIGFYSQSPIGTRCNVEYLDIQYSKIKD